MRTGAGGGDAHGAERAGGKKTGIGEVCDVRGCVRRPQRGRRLRRDDFFLTTASHNLLPPKQNGSPFGEPFARSFPIRN